MEPNIPTLPFSKEQLLDALKKKLVSVRKHPTENYFIFNYTPLTQYSQEWNDVTKTCRGLILDDNYNVVARPFPKIFNYTEVEPDPIVLGMKPLIHDKLDGSLGIAYKGRDGWAISTRGSFVSDQALWATSWLSENHPHYNQPDSVTCLFEIIYPENRVCVNYGEKAELILIAAINNATGSDYPIELANWWSGSVVQRILNVNSIIAAEQIVHSEEYDSLEGLVCTWYKYNKPSFRLKIKNPEYVRLHGIIHSFSKKKVWDSLSRNENFLELLHDVPDEFYDIVKETVNDLLLQFKEIEKFALEDYEEIKHLNSRKAFAKHAEKSEYKSILFKLIDGKDYAPIIWKMIKPNGDV